MFGVEEEGPGDDLATDGKEFLIFDLRFLIGAGKGAVRTWVTLVVQYIGNTSRHLQLFMRCLPGQGVGNEEMKGKWGQCAGVKGFEKRGECHFLARQMLT
jgi:hypothetical protein